MSDKEVRVRITGDISDLLNKLERVKDAFNDIGKNDINGKGVNDFIDNLQRAQDEMELIEASMDEVVGTTKKFDNNGFDRFTDDILDSSKQIDKMADSMKELNNQTKELSINQEMDDYYKSLESIADIGDTIKDSFGSINKDINFDTKDSGKDLKSNLVDSLITGEVIAQRLDNTFDGVKDSIESMSDSLKNITDGLDLNKVVESFNELPKNIEKSKNNLEELYKEAERLREIASYEEGYFDGENFVMEKTKEAKEAEKQLKIIEELIAAQEKLLKSQEGTSIKSLNNLDRYSKYYEQLSKSVNDFINDESNSVFIREKVAKSFQDVTKAMEDMYKVSAEGSPTKSISKMQKEYESLGETIEKINKQLKDMDESRDSEGVYEYEDVYEDVYHQREKLIKQHKELGYELEKLKRQSDLVNKSIGRISDNNLDDKIGDIASESKNLAKSLSLVDFDTLKTGLNNLGKDVEDKREKLIKFREINKELDDVSRKVVNSLNKQGQGIKKFADNAGFAVEVFEELIDNARVIGSDGFNIVGNEEALKRQAELIEKNKDEFEQFIATLKDSGMDIPKRFIDEFNRLDLSKFVKEIETFGKPMNQLSSAMQSYKQQILENMKYEKESIESKRKLAKETLEQAQANKKAADEAEKTAKIETRYADSLEKSIEAVKKVEETTKKAAEAREELSKAEKEYADINKDSIDEKRINNAKDLVKQYNDLAKVLREMGAAAKDINLDDIKDFDKSLGTNLKDIFPDDTPKQFRDFIEDIKAAFSELGDLEFGNFIP